MTNIKETTSQMIMTEQEYYKKIVKRINENIQLMIKNGEEPLSDFDITFGLNDEWYEERYKIKDWWYLTTVYYKGQKYHSKNNFMRLKGEILKTHWEKCYTLDYNKVLKEIKLDLKRLTNTK